VFIKTEVLDQLGLSVTNAAQVLAVRRATLSHLVTKKAFQLNMDMLLRM
jgi:plasmid maintenance system antidote protein VapI